MKKLILLALCACISFGASAAKKTGKKKKSKEPVEVVDTVCIDTFSYHFGRANSNGLKNFLAQRMGIDTTYVADFLKGFEQMALTEADKREKARLAGIEIRQQVEEQVYPGASKQVNDRLLRRECHHPYGQHTGSGQETNGVLPQGQHGEEARCQPHRRRRVPQS